MMLKECHFDCGKSFETEEALKVHHTQEIIKAQQGAMQQAMAESQKESLRIAMAGGFVESQLKYGKSLEELIEMYREAMRAVMSNSAM